MGIGPNRELMNHILIRKSLSIPRPSVSMKKTLFKNLSYVMAYVVQVKDFTKTSAPTLVSEIVINVSWMSTALELFIVTQAGPCHHLYLYLTVTFFEISRLILCTPILTTTKSLTTKDHSKIRKRKHNKLHKCMRRAQKWWVRRGQCSANSWLNISVYFSISLPCGAHVLWALRMSPVWLTAGS